MVHNSYVDLSETYIAEDNQRVDGECPCNLKSELKDGEDATNESCNVIKIVENECFERLLKTCSSFSKLRRTLAYVLRYIRILRTKVKETTPISVSELKALENRLYQWCQPGTDIKELCA